jgi:phosphatidylinositol dimannoside acyltransferase
MKSRREIMVRHQTRITPSLAFAAASVVDERVRATFDSYAQYWVSMFRLQGKSQSQIDAGIHVDGAEHIDAALALGHGAIMAMPHIGAWDHGGAWLAGHWPLTVVAERLEPPALFDWFCEQRAKTGMRVVALGDETGGTELISALRNNEVIGLLCDRDIVGGGIEVSFFGEPATMPAGPAMLSLRTGAAILPNAVYQRPDGTAHGVIRPPIQFARSGKLRADVTSLTQLLADQLAELIAEAPHQWHVLQPHWLADHAEVAGKSPIAGSVG